MRQIFIVIIICYLLACENNKQNTNQEINKDIGEIQIKKQPYQKKEFVYSIKNIKDKYKNIKIVLEKDSLKILDLEFQLMICSSEIIKRKKHIKDYWGIGNSKEIKKELWNGLGFQLTDSIEVIENVKSELSREGCQFPFYEMFISNNFLFFYDENYYCFVPKEVEESLDKKIHINETNNLPFSSSKYLIWYENSRNDNGETNDFFIEDSFEGVDFVEKLIIDKFLTEKENIGYILPIESNSNKFYLFVTQNFKIITVDKKKEVIIDYLNFDYKSNDINWWLEKSFIITQNLEIIFYKNKGKNNIIKESIPYKKYQIQEDGRIIEL